MTVPAMAAPMGVPVGLAMSIPAWRRPQRRPYSDVTRPAVGHRHWPPLDGGGNCSTAVAPPPPPSPALLARAAAAAAGADARLRRRLLLLDELGLGQLEGVDELVVARHQFPHQRVLAGGLAEV